MRLIKFKEQNLIFGKNQPEYLLLPAHNFNDENGRVVFCWQMTWKERIKVLFTGLLWHEVLTFNQPLQPQKMGITKPKMVVD